MIYYDICIFNTVFLLFTYKCFSSVTGSQEVSGSIPLISTIGMKARGRKPSGFHFAF